MPKIVQAMSDLGYPGQSFRVLYLNGDKVDTVPDVFTAEQMASRHLIEEAFVNGVIWRPDIAPLRGRDKAMVLVEISLNFGNSIVTQNSFSEHLVSAVGVAEAGFRLPRNVESAGIGTVRNTLASNPDELVAMVVERATEGLPR